MLIKTGRRYTGAVLACVLALLTIGQARAIDPGWYAPADSGEGIVVRCNDGGQCAVAWLTHDKSREQIWLIGRNTCAQVSALCDVDLAVTTGAWRSSGGETVVGETVVFATLVQDGDALRVDFDARLLFPDRCGLGDETVTPGGLLFRQCVGQRVRFDLLAR